MSKTGTRQPEPINARQAGELLDLTSRQVRRLALSGEVPYLAKLPGDKGRGAYIFDRSVIEQIAAERKAGDAA